MQEQSFETLEISYQKKRRHSQEDAKPQYRSCENPRVSTAGRTNPPRNYAHFVLYGSLLLYIIIIIIIIIGTTAFLSQGLPQKLLSAVPISCSIPPISLPQSLIALYHIYI
jgi:hypothetical protein